MAQQDLKIYNLFRTKAKRQVAIITLTVLIILAILPSFILLLASLVYRLVVKLIATKHRPDLTQIFRGKGMFSAIESIYTQPKFNIVLHMFCNGPLPVEHFRLQFEQRILNYTNDQGSRPYEKFTQTWTDFMGYLFWKCDKNFNLDNHIRRYDYTEPELALPAKCTEDDLKRITGDLIARPWVEGRSPWEILIVPDYRTKQEPEKVGSVAILRIHHAMIDGYSILTMLLRFGDCLTAKRVTPNFLSRSLTQNITRLVLVLTMLPYGLAEFVVDTFDAANYSHYLSKTLSRKYHVFFSDEVNVEDMKKILKKYGVDYNATVYSIVSGSIRRLMLDSGYELPESLSVFVPFPLPDHPGGLNVHLSATCFKFYPRIESAQERIRQVAGNLKTMQDIPTGPTACGYFVEFLALFPIFFVRFMHNKLMMTIGMTSIPGPGAEIPFLAETKMTGMCLALGHMANVVAVASIVSMAGKQRLTLTVDKSVFEGSKVPTRFAEIVNQEIQELLNKN